MTKNRFIDMLKTSLGLIVGVSVHHFGSKILDRSETQAEAASQEIRDNKLDEINNSINYIRSSLDECVKNAELSKNNSNIPQEDVTLVRNSIDEIVNTVNSFKDVPLDDNTKIIVDQKVNIVEKALKTVSDTIEKFSSDKDKFIPDFNLQSLYDFLDSLTLLEESAFIHICMFIFILLCLCNIILIFFGNEIIKFFKLEEKYPKLGLFLNIRSKFSRYNLMWNIFLIILVCFLAIFLNLLIFYSKL